MIYMFKGKFKCGKCEKEVTELYAIAPDVLFAVGMIQNGDGLCMTCFDEFAHEYNIDEWLRDIEVIPHDWVTAQFLVDSAADFLNFAEAPDEQNAIKKGLEAALLNQFKVPEKVLKFINKYVSPEEQKFAIAEYALRQFINWQMGEEYVSLEFEAVFAPFVEDENAFCVNESEL